MNSNAIDFLLYSYFGITQADLVEKDEEKLVVKCAQRAYQDLCRTLKFREKTSADGLSAKEKRKIEEAHNAFRDGICQEISRLVLTSLLAATPKEEEFDEKHKDACDAIYTEAAKKPEVLRENLSYGQAQKWLNMTMKYMWLLGLWEDQFEKMLPVLHVPVDSYIMEAASDCGMCIPTRAGGGGKYESEKSKPWSQWTGEEYRKFQTDLRKVLKPQVPLKWEGPAWIDIAQKRASN